MGRRTTPQTFDDVLAKIRRESKSTRELGDRFESLMVDFFSTDRHYSNRFVKVQKWRAWPGNDGRPDTGIDLVAEERDGTLCAIQCKCHDEDSTLAMKGIANFPALASGQKFGRMMLVYTGGSITSNAESLLRSHRCQILRSEDLRASSLDWSVYPRRVAKSPKKLRDYQQSALDDVLNGFKSSDRGKLVMACGTGKTLVALHIAERLAGKGGTVLYLVPSISLIYQSMREWSDNANSRHYYVAVCSDKSVGEEGSILELECPVSTDAKELRANLSRRPRAAMTVVFSTYHSIRAAAGAAVGGFDLVFCDEAHRTTGVENDTHYTFVHRDGNVRAKRRLYMTATPKIYGEAAKGAARGRLAKKRGKKEGELGVTALYSMDDEKTYGPEFHKLGFVDAVHKHQALADFRVIIPMVSPEYMNTKLQQSVAEDGAIPLNEQTLLAAVWHGLQYPDGEHGHRKLLQKVIAFTNRIDRSEMFAGVIPNKDNVDISFPRLVQKLSEAKKEFDHRVAIRHIDGKKNALRRREEMRWLGESGSDPDTCRILSNARCLSEGIDVPALDGVVFLNPRESIVDIVQSVGRVMRKAPGKDTGYVVLPVAIPVGVDTAKALSDHPAFRTVWQVLNALRSHDESLAREINSLILDRERHKPGGITTRISASILDVKSPDKLDSLDLFDKMKSTAVRKVGDIDYYNAYGRQIGAAAATVELRIRSMLETSLTRRRELDKFHSDLMSVINDSVTRDDAIRVIAQHVVLARVFDELFKGEFTTHNPISKVLSFMAASFGLDIELSELEGFYNSVKNEVQNVNTRTARQKFITTIYGNFFKSTSQKDADKHGIVFTPPEVVDFIIYSIEHILKTQFKTSFNERDVKVLEPFAGTGIFLTRLLDSGLIRNNIYSKYRNDLFANEIMLLAYYISVVNIETTYSSLRHGQRYVPFEGMNYTDTLQQNPRHRHSTEHRQEQATLVGLFKESHERIKQQKNSHVHVIMGNPPYSSRQDSHDDANPNTKYPIIDARITDIYAKNLNVQNKNSLYDSYIRAIRWATDRIGSSGIVAFITNASFLRSEVGSGMRASLIKEFDAVYCLDLRGNIRITGKTNNSEGENIFGSDSQTPVAITIMIKRPKKKNSTQNATVYYKNIGNNLHKSDKITKLINYGSIKNVPDWNIIAPDKHNDWLEQRSNEFYNYFLLGDKDQNDPNIIFRTYSLGIATHRDAWMYNKTRSVLIQNMTKHIEYCNTQNLNSFKIEPTSAKWSRDLIIKLKRKKTNFDQNKIRMSLYRPFFKQWLYFDQTYIDEDYQIPHMFPNSSTQNLVICIPYKFSGNFSIIITDLIPDLHVIQANQCFSYYTYDSKGTKSENITDNTLHFFRAHYKTNRITKYDIFYYIYGLLHHTKYREKFEANLAKEIPRIPLAPNFRKFSSIGKQLADLHINFDKCKRFNLGQPLKDCGNPIKIGFGKKGRKSDKSKILINKILIFENIPQTNYVIDGRTPLEWIVNRYNQRIDKKSLITNTPLKNMKMRDIISIIEQAVYVGTESDRLIAALPAEFEPKNWEPKKTGLDAHMTTVARKRK